MLTSKTRPPTAAEFKAAHGVVARHDPELVAAVTVMVRADVRPAVRRVGRELAAWLLLITLVTGVGMWRTEAAVDRVGRESIERQVDGCERTNEFREFLRDDLARRAEPIDPAEVRALPQYLALPANVRPIVDYFLAVVVEGRENAAVVRDVYLEDFPLVDCAALREELEGGG